MKKPISYEKVFAKFPQDMQRRVKARAGELIAEEMALRDIRKSRALTQEQVAKRLGGKQVYVSRLESRSDVKVSTLRDYVHALGGELQLMVTFPTDINMKSKRTVSNRVVAPLKN
jgi:predicted transcriptional regulator